MYTPILLFTTVVCTHNMYSYYVIVTCCRESTTQKNNQTAPWSDPESYHSSGGIQKASTTPEVSAKLGGSRNLAKSIGNILVGVP